MYKRYLTALPLQGTRLISTGNAAPARPALLGRGGLLACLKDARSITSIGVIGTGCVGCVLVVGEEFKSGR